MTRWAVAFILLVAVPASAMVNASVDVEAPVEGPDFGARLGDAAATVGNAVGGAVGAVGDAAAAALRAVANAGGAIAAGTAALVGAIGSGLAAAGIGIGYGITTAIVATISFAWTAAVAATQAVGSALAFAFTAVWGAIALLRPEAMPRPAFHAMAASGAAVSVTAGGWALWDLARRYGLFGGIAGFSRIADDKLLEHPVRNQIFTLIKENPGIHASQIARETGGGWGTVNHHLDKLHKANLVATRRVNNQKCFFEQGGQVSRKDMAVASALKGDTAAQITSFVQAHPMSSQKDLAQALGISAALVSFHVKKLANLGVIEKMRQGKSTLLTTTESLRRLVAAGDVPVAPMVAS